MTETLQLGEGQRDSQEYKSNLTPLSDCHKRCSKHRKSGACSEEREETAHMRAGYEKDVALNTKTGSKLIPASDFGIPVHRTEETGERDREDLLCSVVVHRLFSLCLRCNAQQDARKAAKFGTREANVHTDERHIHFSFLPVISLPFPHTVCRLVHLPPPPSHPHPPD